MKKKLGDVTLREMADFCSVQDCIRCPFGWDAMEHWLQTCLGGNLEVLMLDVEIELPDIPAEELNERWEN